jgi:hypothetical protein
VGDRLAVHDTLGLAHGYRLSCFRYDDILINCCKASCTALMVIKSARVAATRRMPR